MAWDRHKTIISIAPKKPSIILWFGMGFFSFISGALLFVLHNNQPTGLFQNQNIWVLSAIPVAIWLSLAALCLWRYKRASYHHQFESHQAEYAQQQWDKWSGRYHAILHHTVLLPGFLTVAHFIQPPRQLQYYYQQVRRVPWGEEEGLTILLKDVSEALLQRPIDLPLHVTLLTDSHQDILSLQVLFKECWQKNMPTEQPVPDPNIQRSCAFLDLTADFQLSKASMELILVLQLQGGVGYSDALVVLLLVSDDIADQHQLKHDARLLRPMPLEKSQQLDDFALFFSSQTPAKMTKYIVGDQPSWANDFILLLNASRPTGGSWCTEHFHWLENYIGICGPFSPWLVTAVASDITSLQQVGCLLLSSDSEHDCIATVMTGNCHEAKE